MLVEIRGQRRVVSEPPVPGYDENSTLITLRSVEDGRYGESLQVIWEVEPGRKILPAGPPPKVAATGFDLPERRGSGEDDRSRPVWMPKMAAVEAEDS